MVNNNSKHNAPGNHPSWGNLVILIFISAFAYMLMEWLFMVTKPSFMESLPLIARVDILFFSNALIVIIVLAVLIPLIVISFLPGVKIYRDRIIYFSAIFPAAIFAVMSLLWLDNFTYTLFKFGIVTAQGIERGVYAIIFLGFLAVFYYWCIRLLKKPPQILAKPRIRNTLLAGLMLVTLFSLHPMFSNTENDGIAGTIFTSKNKISARRPHILWITADGVNADHMSVYGYERDTTPIIKQFAETALVAENAFTNAANTTGSVISMYTGKYASTTRVLYPPNILTGANAYQHLPGILKSLGYRTVQITAPYYIDAYTLNVLDGFDSANGRTISTKNILPVLGKYIPNNFSYFIFEIANRAYDRLLHIFYLRNIENPYQTVTEPEPLMDQQRVEQLLNEIRLADGPLFVHVHLLSTHGPYFEPAKRIFSTDQSRNNRWDPNGYDDSIIEFDTDIGKLLDLLSQKKLLNKTLLILGSDHGEKYTRENRIPLIMRFPNGEYSGRLEPDVQNIDIAPTILDYLNIEKPEWMQGQSLLQENLPDRPIFAFAVQNVIIDEDNNFTIDKSKTPPPFYQFGKVSLLSCQQWYDLSTSSRTMVVKEIKGYSHCSETDRLSEEQAIDLLIAHLKQNGFDASSLENTVTVQK